jgi:RND family efflux transporter MFP subunit
MDSESTPKQRSISRRVIIIAVILLIVLSLFIAVKKGRERLASAPRWQPRPVPISVKPVERAVVRQTISTLARLESLATAEIAPEISARVEQILVDEGSSVDAGQLLARLDDRDIQAQIRGLDAKIAAQDARLKGNRAALESARQSVAFLRREFERDQRLFNEKGTSASVLESSRNQLDTAFGKLQELEQDDISIGQERRALAAQLEEARTRLSYTEVRSPSRGVVRRCYAEVGDMAKAGSALFSLMDYACHRLAFDLVQEDLLRVAPGQPVLVRWPGDVEPAVMEPQGTQVKLTRIFPSLEAGKTVRAEVDLCGRLPGSLRIGSFIPIEIVVREAEGLTVDRSALIPMEGGGSGVYVVRSGALDLVRVKKVFSDERLALVEGEIKEGDQVAVGEYLQWVRRSRGQLVEVRP